MPQLGTALLTETWNQHVNAIESDRRANALELINYYNGDQIQYIMPFLKLENNKDPFPYYWTGITKKIINKASGVYKLAPRRFFGDKAEKNQGYEDITPTKDIWLKVSERQVHLLGTIGLRPIVVAAEKALDYMMIRDFQVYFGESNIRPSAVRYPVETAANNETIIYDYWTDDEHLLLTGNNVEVDDPEAKERHGILDDGSNKYKVIPFVWLHSEEIIDDFWNTGGNADDLKMANLHINLMLSEMAHKFRFQSFNPVWISGVDPNVNDIKISYNSALVLTPEDAEVGSINASHDFLNDVETIKFQIQLIERNWNLNIDWGIQGNPASGFSLVVQNMDHTDDLEDFTDVARDWERKLLKMEETVAKVDNLPGVPTEKMRVDFTEIKQPISQKEKNAKWQFEFDNQLATRREYWISENPDITPAELDKREAALEEEAAKLRTAPTTDDLFITEV